jgi:hypothetical protein
MTNPIESMWVFVWEERLRPYFSFGERPDSSGAEAAGARRAPPAPDLAKRGYVHLVENTKEIIV